MVKIIASLDEFGHFSDSLVRRWIAGNKERTNAHLWQAYSDSTGGANCRDHGGDPIRIETLILTREKS